VKYISLLLPLLWLQQSFAEEHQSVTERIEFIEEKQGLHFKKRDFQPILEGDFLFWKGDVDGTATALSFERKGNAATHVKTRTPHFSYDPGFRLGAGIQSPYDFFDFVLLWTRFYTEGSDHAHGPLITGGGAPGDRILLDLIGTIGGGFSVPDSITSRCGLRENLLDLQLARGIEVSPHFFMRPYFGVRGVFSDIDWRIKAKRDFILLEDQNQDAFRLHVKNDFRGVGGLIGLELDWKAPLGFGINMRGAGALKYVFVPAGGLEKSHQTYRAENSFHSLKAMWEMFLGVFWETDFCNKKEHKESIVRDKERKKMFLRLLAGYELQEWPWFGQKTNVQATRDRDRFSVGFQGFTGSAKLVF
jgi:hypothetical protein